MHPTRMLSYYYCQQWRILDFPKREVPTAEMGWGANLLFGFFAKDCLKMKNFGLRGRGSVLDAPLFERFISLDDLLPPANEIVGRLSFD